MKKTTQQPENTLKVERTTAPGSSQPTAPDNPQSPTPGSPQPTATDNSQPPTTDNVSVPNRHNRYKRYCRNNRNDSNNIVADNPQSPTPGDAPISKNYSRYQRYFRNNRNESNDKTPTDNIHRPNHNGSPNSDVQNEEKVSLKLCLIRGFLGAQFIMVILVLLSVTPTWTALIPISVAILFIAVPIFGLIATVILFTILALPVYLINKLRKRK